MSGMIKNLKYVALLSFCLMGCEKSTIHTIDGGVIPQQGDGGAVTQDNDDDTIEMWWYYMMNTE
jgi:hypothetical protein